MPTDDSPMAQHRITVGEEVRYDTDLKTLRTLNSTYAQIEPRIINFAQQPGVSRTGSAACDSALASVIASANHGSPVQIVFPPGKYKFNSPWPSIDPMSVTIRGSGAASTKVDLTGVPTASTALTIAFSDYGHVNKSRVMGGIWFDGPLDASTTFLAFGGPSTYSPFLEFDDITVSGFGTQLLYQDNTWLHTWISCTFFNSQTACVNLATANNAGENIAWIGCAFYNHAQETIVNRMAGTSVSFTHCSFDYSGRAINMDRGYIKVTGCHIEGDDTRIATGASEYILVTETAGQKPGRLVIDGGWIYPAWATRPQIITVGGTGGAALIMRDVKVSATTAQPGIKLVVDSASAPSTVVLDEVQQEGNLAVPGTAQVSSNGRNTLSNTSGPILTLAGPASTSRDIKLSSTSGGVAVDRWYLRASGAETGSNSGTDFSLVCRQDDGASLYSPLSIKRATGAITLARSFAQAVSAQTLGANGAVTINAFNGNIHPVTLAANATSSSIINGNTGQIITIEWVQDATGGRTYVWPTNCKFAGGAAPAQTTTATARDSVTFRYDGTNWIESARATTLPVTGYRVPGIIEPLPSVNLSGAVTTAAGDAWFASFIADQSVTISNLATATNGQAQAGATLIRYGLFTVNASGDLTLVARTADLSASAWAATASLYSAPLDATGGYPLSYAITTGQRYAVGCLGVGMTTPAKLLGGFIGNSAVANFAASGAGRRTLHATGQTDLSASYTAVSLTNNSSIFWCGAN